MLFFIFVFIVYLLINIYIFLKGWKAFGNRRYRKLKILYSTIFFVFFGSFIISMLLRNVLPLAIQKPLYFLGTTWLAIILYITLYFLITDLVKVLDNKFNFLSIGWKRYPQTYKRIQVISGSIIVLVLLIIGYQKFTHPIVFQQDIYIEKSAGNIKELKVVGLSDLHLGITVDKHRLKNYVKQINAQKPDMIIIAGDLIDNNLFPLNEEKMWEEINQLQAPIYMCLGNHEYLSGIEGSLDFIKKTKINLLRDEVQLVNDSFYIIGRDDRIVEHGIESDKKRMSVSQLVSQTDKSKPLILLNHQPYNLDEVEENGIDFQFSGHTHAGQLFPLNIIIRGIYEVSHGYKRKGNTHIYVSSGLALWGPQYRIGTQSEIAVFNIKFK